MYSIVGADGREYGPVDVGVLIQWARDGRVIARTTILDHTTGRRFLACDMAELAPIVSSSAVAPPVGGAGGVAPPYVAGVPAAYVGRSPRNKIAAGVLGILLPGLGIHRFYLGYTGIGVIQLLMTLVLAWPTCGLTAVASMIWSIVDGIMCLTGGLPDAEGRPLSD